MAKTSAHSRVALVTGGTDGIGKAVAIELARRGSRVLIVGRDEARGEAVMRAMNESSAMSGHAFLRADLSLLSETTLLADSIHACTDRLDSIVLCAGRLSTIPEWTHEALEVSFVLNYLSRFLLVQRLLPMLAKSSSGRVVLVANAGVYPDTLDFDDLQLRRARPGLHVAGGTQFANDLFAIELAERLRNTRVEVTCVAPGMTRTSVFRNAHGLPTIVRALLPVLVPLMAQAPERAALTPAYLAHDPHATGLSGRFFGPKVTHREVPERARNRERRRLLWTASEALTRSYFETSHRASHERQRAHG